MPPPGVSIAAPGVTYNITYHPTHICIEINLYRYRRLWLRKSNAEARCAGLLDDLLPYLSLDFAHFPAMRLHHRAP